MNKTLQDFMQHTTQADTLCRELVRADLRKMIALAEQEQAIAAKKLNTAYGELTEARKPVTELEAEIAKAESEAQEWTLRQSGTIGEQVAAGIWRKEWATKIAELRDELARLQTSIYPYQQVHAKAKRDFTDIGDRIGLLNANLYDPYIGYGPTTDAYKTYRCGYGSVIRVLTMMNGGAFEWGSAVKFLHELAALAGFDLVSNSDRLLKADHDERLKDYRAKHSVSDASEGKIITRETEDTPVKDDYRFQPAKAKVPRKEMELPYKQ